MNVWLRFYKLIADIPGETSSTFAEQRGCQLTRRKHKLMEAIQSRDTLEVRHFLKLYLPLFDILYKLYVDMLVTINDHLCPRRGL